MKTRRWFFLALMMMALIAGVAAAGEKEDDAALKELKQRFMERDPILLNLNHEGRIGEMWNGMTAVVHDADAGLRLDDQGRIDKDQSARPDDKRLTLGQLVAQENSDRTKLYAIIARRQRTTPDVVAKNNAQRLFDLAAPGVWQKHSAGEDWKRKPDPKDK